MFLTYTHVHDVQLLEMVKDGADSQTKACTLFNKLREAGRVNVIHYNVASLSSSSLSLLPLPLSPFALFEAVACWLSSRLRNVNPQEMLNMCKSMRH